MWLVGLMVIANLPRMMMTRTYTVRTLDACMQVSVCYDDDELTNFVDQLIEMLQRSIFFFSFIGLFLMIGAESSVG